MHMAAARLGCKRTVVGTGWANSWPGCMSRLRKCAVHMAAARLGCKGPWLAPGGPTLGLAA